MDVAVVTLPASGSGGAGTIEWVTDDTAADYESGINDSSPAFSPDGRWLAWARGHEDDWTNIVIKGVGASGSPSVLLNGTHWFRGGLDW